MNWRNECPSSNRWILESGNIKQHPLTIELTGKAGLGNKRERWKYSATPLQRSINTSLWLLPRLTARRRYRILPRYVTRKEKTSFPTFFSLGGITDHTSATCSNNIHVQYREYCSGTQKEAPFPNRPCSVNIACLPWSYFSCAKQIATFLHDNVHQHDLKQHDSFSLSFRINA